MGRKVKNKICVGIDPGQKCGYAVLSVNQRKPVIDSVGCWKLKSKKCDSYGIQLHNLENNIYDLFEDVKPKILVYELIRFHHGNDATQVYGFIRAGIEYCCETYRIKYFSMVPSTIRKIVFGNGLMKKPQIRKILEKRFDCRFNGYDESDAVACALGQMIRLGWIDG